MGFRRDSLRRAREMLNEKAVVYKLSTVSDTRGMHMWCSSVVCTVHMHMLLQPHRTRHHATPYINILSLVQWIAGLALNEKGFCVRG